MCYGTVKNAYVSSPLPPLGTSDHIAVHLRPTYKTLVEREKPQTRTVKIWNNDSIMALQGCFDCTIWEVFKHIDINAWVVAVSDYITFCMESVIPMKTFKVFPNDKPWVSYKLNNPERQNLQTRLLEGTYRDKKTNST